MKHLELFFRQSPANLKLLLSNVFPLISKPMCIFKKTQSFCFGFITFNSSSCFVLITMAGVLLSSYCVQSYQKGTGIASLNPPEDPVKWV